MQNIENDHYSLDHCDTFVGTTDTIINAEIKDFPYFNYNPNMSSPKGKIDGDGSRILRIYYTRYKYNLYLNNNVSGTITNKGQYKYGEKVTSTASPYLGYVFSGWYNDEGVLLSTNLTYSFTIEQDVIAKFTVKSEMAGFTFASSWTFCKITGVKDKNANKIIIPDYVSSIGDYAFSGCYSLTSVEIPNSVTSIDSYAFEDCISLTSITIPNSVTCIGSDAFGYCSSLISVVIPDSVTSIRNGTFYKCSSLTSITIPNSVTSIGEGAFDNCSSLTSVVIPNSVTSIGSDAFDNCSSLTSIYITDLTSWCNIKFSNFSSTPLSPGATLYLNNQPITTLTIPNDVTSIRDYAFAGCDSLTSVEIPNSVTSIGEEAFRGCNSLTSVVIGDSVTSIGAHAFAWCDGLTSVEIPNSVTSIGLSAFHGCYSLPSVVIPDSVTSIGSSAFYNCSSLKCNIDGNLKYLGNSSNPYVYLADTTSTSITFAKINDNCKFIGDYAFQYCDSLTSVEIPDSVTSIGSFAFHSCDSLTSIEIPDSVTSIGSFAFSNCSNLKYNIEGKLKYLGNSSNPYVYLANAPYITSVKINDNCKIIGAFAFDNCYSLTSVEIPNSVTSIGSKAFYFCDNLTSVVIPDSVTYIGSEAFSGCGSLTIYCKAKSQPTNWSFVWNAGRPVVWGYTGE